MYVGTLAIVSQAHEALFILVFTRFPLFFRLKKFWCSARGVADRLLRQLPSAGKPNPCVFTSYAAFFPILNFHLELFRSFSLSDETSYIFTDGDHIFFYAPENSSNKTLSAYSSVCSCGDWFPLIVLSCENELDCSLSSKVPVG